MRVFIETLYAARSREKNHRLLCTGILVFTCLGGSIVFARELANNKTSLARKINIDVFKLKTLLFGNVYDFTGKRSLKSPTLKSLSINNNGIVTKLYTAMNPSIVYFYRITITVGVTAPNNTNCTSF